MRHCVLHALGTILLIYSQPCSWITVHVYWRSQIVTYASPPKWLLLTHTLLKWVVKRGFQKYLADSACLCIYSAGLDTKIRSPFRFRPSLWEISTLVRCSTFLSACEMTPRNTSAWCAWCLTTLFISSLYTCQTVPTGTCLRHLNLPVLCGLHLSIRTL